LLPLASHGTTVMAAFLVDVVAGRYALRCAAVRSTNIKIMSGGGNGGDQLGLVFGQIAVTQLLKPALIRSNGGVVNIGSVGGKIAVATHGPYAGTKFEPAGA
jgi:NAD(P)-dependent dehydrogenase (short-subunit alcohol dehydrogenase family)